MQVRGAHGREGDGCGAGRSPHRTGRHSERVIAYTSTVWWCEGW